MARMTPLVLEVPGGWLVRRGARDDGRHDRLVTALDHADTLSGRPRRDAYLRRDGEPHGVWRWIDAAAEENRTAREPRVGARTIRELAESVIRSDVAIPIDGGIGSRVHGTAVDSATPANGWVHGAVPVYVDGRWHLYVWAELLPEVASELDSGRLAHASIHAGGDVDSGELVRARLISVGLTNVPAIETLRPSSTVMTMVRIQRQEPDMAMEERVAALEQLVAALDQRLTALEQKLAESGDQAAQAAESAEETADLLAAELARTREQQAASAKRRAEEIVDGAIARGLIEPGADERARWLRLAERDPGHVERIFSRLRPVVPTELQARSGSASKNGSVDGSDARVRAMRSAGVSDAMIRKHLLKEV